MATIASANRTTAPSVDFIGVQIYDGPPIRFPLSAATLEGFCDWATSEAFPERLHASFINEEIIFDMSPEKLESHSKVKGEIGRVVMNDTCDRLMHSQDIQEFYLGAREEGARGERRWKKKKTWR